MPPLLSLHCLGTPALYGEDGAPVRLRVRKHLALIVFLAMEPRIHRRDRLADLLWPGATRPEGRHSLATALSVLRAHLGHSAVEATRETVRLRPGSVELDLDRLAAGDVVGSDTVPPLVVAPLLDEFDIADSPAWGQWKDAQEATWQPRIRDALLVLIDRSRRTGDSRTIERLADSLLAIDPLSEEGIRAKMEARAFAGDRLSALSIFEAWKVRLGEEVKAQPSELIEGMAVRLRRRGWERSARSEIAPVPTDQWKNRTFVGRAAEYQHLYEAWEECQRGAPRHVVLTGDSGVGKSTLAERLSTAAGLQGGVSAREQCHEVERDVPYSAVGALALALLDRPGAGTVAPEWLGELSRIVSEVRRRYPGAPIPVDAEGETVRIRIADAFTELAIAVSEEQPLVLVLDDLHLADDASVAVLHHLLRRIERHRILVIFTARPGELAGNSNAQRLIESSDSLGLGGAQVLPLTLGESETLLDLMISARGATSPRPPVRRALLRSAGGYPMVLELLVDDWLASGDECLALTLEGMTENASRAEPGVVYGQILNRLATALIPSTRHVLNLASILGARLNDLALYALVDLTLAETMAGLSQLTAARILRDAGEGLEFINELMRARAYGAVPSPVRRVLHHKVADVLIARADAGEARLGLEIAWHCVRARRKEEFASYLIPGADEAIEQGAHAVAERALLTGIPGLEGRVRAEAQYRLGLILQDQGRWQESAAALDMICPEDAPTTVLNDIPALTAIAEMAVRQAHAAPDQARAALLLSVLKGHPQTSIRLRAAAQLASYTVSTEDGSCVKEALALLDMLKDGPLTRLQRGTIALTQAQLAWPSRDFRRLFELLEVARRTADEVAPNGMLALKVAHGLGVTLGAAGRYLDASQIITHGIVLAERIGNQILAGGCRAAIAGSYLRLGRYDECLDSASRVLRDLADGGIPTYLPVCHYYLPFACAMLSRADAAMEGLAAGNRFISRYGGTWVMQAWSLWSADVLWLLGNHEEALRLSMSQIPRDNPELSGIGLAGPFCRWYALAYGSGAGSAGRDRLFLAQVRGIRWRDAVDRAEIGLGASLLNELGAVNQEDLRAALAGIPANLPEATWLQFRALGLGPQIASVNQSQISIQMSDGPAAGEEHRLATPR